MFSIQVFHKFLQEKEGFLLEIEGHITLQSDQTKLLEPVEFVWNILTRLSRRCKEV